MKNESLLFLFLQFFLAVALMMIITMVGSTHVIKRQQSATIATVRNGTERKITVYGARHLKNLRVSSRKFNQCDKHDRYAPCTCLQAHTIVTVDALTDSQKGRMGYKSYEISFTEYDCKSEHPVVDHTGFICAQLTDIKTMYRDAHNNPIEIEVHFNDGCELRCLKKECKGVYDNSSSLTQKD